ncbi:VanZ family protein [Microbacterium sp. 10M-3C3]|jgi:glycopeptide antibiotics resistance protein|uniref:VanZ family protein n=1 Tax=Microbacterium sp. 10M-3C3 TaxID=2483401 RepID=UPI0013DDD2EF|nr:VanZ family protein [Microbacterium sp. 10M-3C3]
MLRPVTARTRGVLVALLVVYALTLAFIAFWPTHVDEGAGHVLAAITRRFPWATYARIEFSANIALFAPFGFLLAGLVRAWGWVIAIGVASSAAIELIQGTLLPGRTASAWDVIANSLGMVAGVVIALIWRSSSEHASARRAPRAS